MIRTAVGELEGAAVDAVVRPVRSDGDAITAAGRRLEVLAGPKVAERLQGLGELPVGGAVITPGGALGVPFIIHAVVQSNDEPVSAMGVQRALLNTLRRAKDLGLGSVAFPLVGTGAGNLDAEVAARLLAEVLRDHLHGGEAPLDFEIRVENEYEEELFNREVAAGDPAGGLG